MKTIAAPSTAVTPPLGTAPLPPHFFDAEGRPQLYSRDGSHIRTVARLTDGRLAELDWAPMVTGGMRYECEAYIEGVMLESVRVDGVELFGEDSLVPSEAEDVAHAAFEDCSDDIVDAYREERK